MKIISDYNYYINSSMNDNTINNIDDIVADYSKLLNSSPDILNGCVVEFHQVNNSTLFKNNNQMVFTNSGGEYNFGYLQYTEPSTDDLNRKFLLEWDSRFGGYYLWPMNGDKQLKLIANINNGMINAFINENDLKENYYKV